MGNIEKFAEILTQFKNTPTPHITFGTVVSLTPVKIKLADENVILSDVNFKSNVDLKQKDSYGRYVNLNKTVSLISYLNNTKFIVLGVLYE